MNQLFMYPSNKISLATIIKKCSELTPVNFQQKKWILTVKNTNEVQFFKNLVEIFVTVFFYCAKNICKIHIKYDFTMEKAGKVAGIDTTGVPVCTYFLKKINEVAKDPSSITTIFSEIVIFLIQNLLTFQRVWMFNF